MASSILSAYAGRLQQAVEITANPLGEGNEAYRHERFGMTGTWSIQTLVINAICRSFLGQFAEARKAADTAVDLARETARPYDIGIAFWTRGAVGIWSGRMEETTTVLEHAHEVCSTQSVGILMPNLIPTLAYAYIADGRSESADRIMESLPAFDAKSPAFWFHGWGAALAGLSLLGVGRVGDAITHLTSWRELIADHGLFAIAPGVEILLSRCRIEAGDTGDEIERDLEAALQLSESIGTKAETARCYLELARLASKRNDLPLARSHSNRAIAMFRELGMTHWESAADELRLSA